MSLTIWCNALFNPAATAMLAAGTRDHRLVVSTHASTNVLQAGTCVVTPIGLDHTEWLGETIEDIATAKAGIIHSGATLICALQPLEAMTPLLERCAEVGATVAREGVLLHGR